MLDVGLNYHSFSCQHWLSSLMAFKALKCAEKMELLFVSAKSIRFLSQSPFVLIKPLTMKTHIDSRKCFQTQTTMFYNYKLRNGGRKKQYLWKINQFSSFSFKNPTAKSILYMKWQMAKDYFIIDNMPYVRYEKRGSGKNKFIPGNSSILLYFQAKHYLCSRDRQPHIICFTARIIAWIEKWWWYVYKTKHFNHTTSLHIISFSIWYYQDLQFYCTNYTHRCKLSTSSMFKWLRLVPRTLNHYL